MTVNLASRISVVLMAGSIVAIGWSPTLHTPSAAVGPAPIAATR